MATNSPTPVQSRRRTCWTLGCVGVIAILVLLGIPLSMFCREQARISGIWQVLRADGSPMYSDGQPVELDLSFPTCWVNPFTTPTQINFRREVGGGYGWMTYRGIYQWEGDQIRYAEASPGIKRPTTFDPDQEAILEPGAGGGSAGVGILRRPEPE
jgi:hypothetical protein